MKKTFLVLFLICVLLGARCEGVENVVYIQPLGKVSPVYIETVKKSIQDFYHFKCVVLPEKTLTKDLLALSKTRYDGAKILIEFKSSANTLILLEKDIAARKGKDPEFGIIGYAFRPGNVCAVSVFRMKEKVSQAKILERLRKVSLHEIGHNMGLNHCSYDPHCLMNDAKGTIRQVDKMTMDLCSNCKQILKFS
jgi:archaemetzincin